MNWRCGGAKVPQVTVRKGNIDEVRNLPADDAFYKSICYFYDCIINDAVRNESYCSIERQARLVDQFRELAKGKKN